MTSFTQTEQEAIINAVWGMIDGMVNYEMFVKSELPRQHGCVTSPRPIAQAVYWDLMNMTRSKPFFPRFTVTEWLKKRY